MHKVTFTTVSGNEGAGTTFNLQVGDQWLSSKDLKGWQINVDGSTGVTSVTPRSFSATVAFTSTSVRDIVNDFTAKVEVDALNGNFGTLDVDGWQLKCIVTSVKCETVNNNVAVYELELYSRYPKWQRTTRYIFASNSAQNSVTTGIDYPYDMPFDFAGTARSSEIVGAKAALSMIPRITFFGNCINPYCRITTTLSSGETFSNQYGVMASAGFGERIIIDPTQKGVTGNSIYKVGQFGERTNLFNNRIRGSVGSGTYIFEPVRAGRRIDISWPQSFDMDIEFIEERGVIPWS